MTTEAKAQAEEAVTQASRHVYEALTHHFGPMDMGAKDPVIKALSEFGERHREHDEAGIKQASEHLYEALTHHFGPLDMGAHQPIVKAIAEYGRACDAAGARA